MTAPATLAEKLALQRVRELLQSTQGQACQPDEFRRGWDMCCKILQDEINNILGE